MSRMLVRLLADEVLVGAVLFLPAGTLEWPHAWILLGVQFIVRTVGALWIARVNPALVRERASLPVHAEQRAVDRFLVLGVLATGFLGLPLVAGLDAFHWHALPRPSVPVTIIGLVLFALGWVLKNVALRANAFAVTVVRVQREREHAVADAGPYRVVRHPFYAADPLIFVGLGLWLGSYIAVLCAVAPLALMVLRLQLEEELLRTGLPEYEAYMKRVRFRLIPGVW
jgi:protein-S-isoprenylcysteine O-methyltransferase Ste14